MKNIPLDAEIISRTKDNDSSLLSNSEITEIILEHRDSSIKMAMSMLKKWNIFMDLDELKGMVDLTLCEVARKFDSSKGASFMTFFYYHMRGKLVRKVTKLAKRSSVFVSCADEAFVENMAASSNDCSERSEWMKVDESASPDFLLLKKESTRIYLEAISSLDDLEKEILTQLFIFEKSVIDLAEELGYSRCHISRVKKRAIKKIRTSYYKLYKGESIETKECDDTTKRGRPPRDFMASPETSGNVTSLSIFVANI